MIHFEHIQAICKGPYHPVCQDAIFFKEDQERICAVVADGLGSRSKSDLGAKWIVSLIGRQLIRVSFEKENDIEERLNHSLKKWFRRIILKGGVVNDYCTTCSFVLIDKRQNKFKIGHIGDSPIFYQADKGSVISVKDEKEFSNLTDCIGLKEEDVFKIETGIYFDNLRVLVCSDGFGDDLNPLYMDKMFDYLQEKYSGWSPQKKAYYLKREITTSLNNINRDDKSAIFIWSK